MAGYRAKARDNYLRKIMAGEVPSSGNGYQSFEEVKQLVYQELIEKAEKLERIKFNQE